MSSLTTTTTPNRGLPILSSGSPDYDSAGPTPGYEFTQAFDNLDGSFAAALYAANGAISQTEGTVLIGGSGVTALTLALPVAGLPGVVAGGMDGKKLRIIIVTAHDHTVTTPSDGVNAANHVITFGGAVGDQAELTAWDGSWYLSPGGSGFTIS
jgi:hypothetical protein